MSRRLLGHNFGVIFKFELRRIITKPSFWVNILIFPAVFALIFGINYISNESADKTYKDLANKKFSIEITDKSNLIGDQMLKIAGMKSVDDVERGIDDVKSGRVDAYYVIPEDLSKEKVKIYAQNTNLFENSKYQQTIKAILKSSVTADIDPSKLAIISDKITSQDTYYRDGQVYDAIGSAIVPLVAIVLVFAIISIFGNQMLSSTVEEKENRISEMLFTTVKADTLIVAKILSLLSAILIQAVIIIGLVTIVYVVASHYINLPGLDLSQIVIDFSPTKVLLSVAIFVLAVLLFCAMMAAIGAIVPTAKEAGQFISIPFILLYLPLYSVATIIANPEQLLATAFLLFPFTAPLVSLGLLATNSLPMHLIPLTLVIMTVSTIALFWIAARAFQRGAISYHRKINPFRLK